MKILYYTNGETYKLGPKSKRLKLVNEPPTRGIASIRLEKTESSDSGKYICDINNPPDFAGTSEIFVNLIVQVPPSTPQCTVSGKPHVGNNITLSCRSTEGRPSPVYVWSEVNPSPGTSAATNVKKDNSKGTLTLRNLTEGNSGTYRCVASNILGQDLCHVVLTVTYNNELGVIVGAVFGTSIALILIGAVAYCLLHRRADHPKPVFVGNELREDALAPGKDPNSQLLESSIALRPGVSHSTDSKYNIVV
ncbi:V-set and immunoglobulin domain-containing protein 2-like [Callorhinchus milii]|nr:V-set and immunoglobulin domain-containing protein 2-like [Callorhinchus milii]